MSAPGDEDDLLKRFRDRRRDVIVLTRGRKPEATHVRTWERISAPTVAELLADVAAKWPAPEASP